MNNNGLTDSQKINFPVSFTLKAIFDNSIAEEKHIENLKILLFKIEVGFKNISSKLSSNGKYISISVNVKVEDRIIFDQLYIGLKSIPGIKYAL